MISKEEGGLRGMVIVRICNNIVTKGCGVLLFYLDGNLK
jgi:hypothetical protein